MTLWWLGAAQAQDWAHWPITITAMAPEAVWVIDLDDDADNDVLYAAGQGRIGWFETIGGAPTAHHLVADGLVAPYDLVPADLDADGDLDLVVAGYGAVTVLWDEGPGWSAPEEIGAESGRLIAVRAVDLDGDADLDLVAIAADADLVVSYANDGAGGFGPSTPVVAVDDPLALAVGDLDADGDADLVVGGAPVDGLAWFANDGAGGFGAPAVVDGVETRGAVAVDLDADGDLDLAGTNWDDGVRWYVNDGTGAFGAPIGLTHSNRGGDERLVAGDADGDGDTDLVATVFDVDCYTPTDCYDGDRLVVAYLNDLAGFTEVTVDERYGLGLGIGEIDGDGDPDLALGDVDGALRWYDRRADGWGAGEQLTTSVSWPRSVVASDLDGDGDLDVAATSNDSFRITTYENL
ncbi:MAG: FG-GAP-like repeat-containing protein, partial [Myxococcota bacterium]